MTTNAEKEAGVKDFATDSAITVEAKAKLLAADGVPSMGISVETNKGIVHLTGHVETQLQKADAEMTVRKIDGVKSVQNDLILKP
jgi:hyperosmotically inducible protein